MNRGITLCNGTASNSQNCDQGENIKDPDWLIEQSIARQVARGGVTLRNDEKGDKIVSVIVAKSKIKFYFLQRLWQQQNCKTSCMKNCLV